MMSSTMVDTGVNRVDSFLKVCKRGLQVMASDQGYEFHLFPPAGRAPPLRYKYSGTRRSLLLKDERYERLNPGEISVPESSLCCSPKAASPLRQSSQLTTPPLHSSYSAGLTPCHTQLFVDLPGSTMLWGRASLVWRWFWLLPEGLQASRLPFLNLSFLNYKWT